MIACMLAVSGAPTILQALDVQDRLCDVLVNMLQNRVEQVGNILGFTKQNSSDLCCRCQRLPSVLLEPCYHLKIRKAVSSMVILFE
jgi:hypothetical protein